MAAQTYVAFLRGVNLGTQRRVKMAELRELLRSHGHGDVETYLQSGNVVLESRLTGAKLEQSLESQLAEGLGFDVDVLVRSGRELADVVERNPLSAVATDPAKYLVTFLRAKPPARLVTRLRAVEVAPEKLAVAGRELYSWHPAGVGRSKLAKLLLPNALGISASGRNWRVVEHLAALASGS
jgi:uncharacterized protein (DUF1697 family)